MERINTSSKQTDKFGTGKHGFTNGNPATGTPATQLADSWFDSVQEEIANVVEGAGLSINSGDRTQLRQAITAMVTSAQKAVVVNGATFEASVTNGKLVRWDSGNSRFDEGVADASINDRVVGVADVTNSKVYLYGECPLFSGLTPGARYYLDPTTPGAMTTTAPSDAIMIGIAKNATTLWVDIDVTIASYARLDAVQTYTKAQRGAVVDLTDGATITPDFSASNNFRVQLGGNRTLDVPSNLVAGQSGIIEIMQDASGSRTLALGWGWSPPGGNAPTLSTAALTRDQFVYYVGVAAQMPVTISIATPGVVTWASHGFKGGEKIRLTTTGALPTGLAINTTYYVKYVDASTFQLSATLGGAAITTSGSQSGVHTATAAGITINMLKGVA